MHEFMRSTECGCVSSVPCATVDVHLYGVCLVNNKTGIVSLLILSSVFHT